MKQEDISPKYFIPDYKDFTSDKRLDKRLLQLSQNLCISPSSNISQLSDSRSEQVAYYRLLENEKLTEEALIAEHTSRMEKLCFGRNLLVLMDTCEVNLCKNKNRIKPGSGIGQSANSESATCFKLHPGLVLNENEFRSQKICVRGSLLEGCFASAKRGVPFHPASARVSRVS